MAGFRWYVRFSQLHRCFLSLETALHMFMLLPMQTYIFVPPLAEHITTSSRCDSPQKFHGKILSDQQFMRNTLISH